MLHASILEQENLDVLYGTGFMPVKIIVLYPQLHFLMKFGCANLDEVSTD